MQVCDTCKICVFTCCVYKPQIHTTEAKPMFLEMTTEEEYELLRTKLNTSVEP